MKTILPYFTYRINPNKWLMAVAIAKPK